MKVKLYLTSHLIVNNLPVWASCFASRFTQCFCFFPLVVCEEEKQPLLLQQAIAKRLAEVFDFVLKFDELKMLRPGLQNDFSFYRRSLGKHAQDPNLLVKDDDASFISLFLAAHIPMMTALSKSASVRLSTRVVVELLPS